MVQHAMRQAKAGTCLAPDDGQLRVGLRQAGLASGRPSARQGIAECAALGCNGDLQRTCMHGSGSSVCQLELMHHLSAMAVPFDWKDASCCSCVSVSAHSSAHPVSHHPPVVLVKLKLANT